MRRTLMTVVTALALILTGCGQRPGVGVGVEGPTVTTLPVDAALVTPTFGWVLTADALLLTNDGGRTFVPADVPVAASSARAAYFHDALEGWMASTDENGIAIAHTTNGGMHWSVDHIAISAPIAAVSLAFGSPGRGVLLAKTKSGSAFSQAQLYTTHHGDGVWKSANAPVAGHVTVEPGGRIWLAGGVLQNELFSSADRGRTWSRAQIRPSESAQVEAVGTPGGGMLAATVTTGTKFWISLLTSNDGGATWAESRTVPLAAASGSAPTVTMHGSATIVVDPAGGRLFRNGSAMSGGNRVATGTDAHGLPAGVYRMTLVDGVGWALASSGRCADGKHHCSITHSLVATHDGGTAWQPVLRWEEKIS